MESANAAFDLGDWHVDVGGNRLLRGGEVRPLRHKAMALLVLLARHAGQTVARETIVDEVWGGNRYVAEKAINTAVWAIRQALGDDPESPRYVQTVAKRGYRLIAPVRPAAAPADAPGQTPRRTWPVLAATGLILATVAGALLVALQRPPADGVAEALATTTPLTQLPGMEYVGRLSPDGRWLAFAWWQGRGDGRLFVREANTPDAVPRALSSAEGDVEGLAWSPDGAALAYVASDSAGRCTLWRVAPGGGDRRALAPCAALFTPGVDWSPDGSTIVFSGQADGVGGLFLVTPDGQGLRRLTAAPPRAMADHQPVWSPDGRRVAFVRQDPSDGTRDLYETTLDGQARRLTHLRLYHWHGLAWAANGRDLVLSTTQQDRRVLLRWDRAAGVARSLGLEGSAPSRSADGSLVYSLLRSHASIARLAADATIPERVIHSVGSDRAPHDEAKAPGPVFVSRRTGSAELWLAPRSGSGERQLTRLDGLAAAPAWSPDGRHIAFLGNCGPAKRYGVCSLDATDGTLRPLTTDAAEYGWPAWHPDGRSVWVTSERGGRWQLWRLDAQSGSAEPVPTEQAPGRALAWAGDGSAIVYEERDSRRLRWRSIGSGAERALATTPGGAALVDWRLGPGGLVTLTRSDRERIERVDPATGRRTPWAERPLGTFPERARLAWTADGALLIEVADAATADLMQLR